MSPTRRPATSLRAQHYRGFQKERRQRVRHTSLGISSPAEITGLRAWYDFSNIVGLWQDAAMTSAVTASGQAILGVTDKSGGGFHLTEATNGPAYTTGIINAKSVARFDGSNDKLQNAAMTADTSMTIFIVAQKRTAPGASSLTLFAVGAGTQCQLYTSTTDGHSTKYGYYADQGGGVVTLTAGTAANVNVCVLRVNSAASLDVFFNGGTAQNIDPNDLITTGTTYSLGSTVAGGQFTDHDVGEVVIYNSALASADLNSVGLYLAGKWGVNWSPV